jgi:hypothetical protein
MNQLIRPSASIAGPQNSQKAETGNLRGGADPDGLEINRAYSAIRNSADRRSDHAQRLRLVHGGAHTPAVMTGRSGVR